MANSSTGSDSKDGRTGLRDDVREVLTSYRYPGYPPTDISIHSSFDQPYLNFDSAKNCFCYSSGDEDPLDSLKPGRTGASPRIIIYMIPGNPGLVEFYQQFLSLLCASFDQIGGCEIVCSSHLGHSLEHNSNLDFRFLENFKLWKLFPSSSHRHPQSTLQIDSSSLADHVEYHSEVVGKIIHQGIGDPSRTKLVVIGHSVGGYIATKVLERYPDQVMHIIGLFPTLSQIARSPNGLRLTPLFSPILLPFLNVLQILVSIALPKMIIYGLITLCYSPISGTKKKASRPAAQALIQSDSKAKDISEQNLLIMLNFILNVNSVSAVLKMARSEMESIRELDTKFMHLFHQQLTIFWASHQADEWVDEAEISEIIEVLDSHPDPSPESEDSTIDHQDILGPSHLSQSSLLFGNKSINSQSQFKPGKVVSWKRMHEGIPHAFCLKDNEVMAKECSAVIQHKLSLCNP